MPEEHEQEEARKDRKIGHFVRALIDFFIKDPKMILVALLIALVGWRQAKEILLPDLTLAGTGITQAQVEKISTEIAKKASTEAAQRAIEISDQHWALEFARLEGKVDGLVTAFKTNQVDARGP
jgi:hypothetical protein